MEFKLENQKSAVKAVVTFTSEEWKAAQEKAYAKLAKNVEVKGFRKGQAPLEMAKKSINPTTMLDEAIDGLVNESYAKLLEEHKDLDIISRPDVKVNKYSDTELELQFDILVRPEVKLGQYKGIEVAKEEVKVSKKEVEEELEKIQKQNAVVAIKEDGVIEKGNVVKFDFKGFVDGKAFEGGEAKDFELEIGSNQFVPGFEDQMVGLKKGEEKDIKVTFPTQYTKELAGKEAVFKLKIKEVSTKTIPELNDDLALDANIEGVSTLEELKKHIEADIKHHKGHEAEDKAFKELIDKIVEGATLELNDRLVEMEQENALADYKARVAQAGMAFEQYLEMTNQTVEKLKEQIKPDAVKNLKTALVFGEISKVEKIKVEEKDIEEEYKNIAAQYGMDVEKVKEALKSREGELANEIYSRKITQFIKENNKITGEELYCDHK